MSVLCCRIPHFLTALELRRNPRLAGRPLALLGPDELVWAASVEARESGVLPAMPARQALLRCADLLLRPLALADAEAEQSAFLAALARAELPIEALSWGAAYLDLHSATATARQAQPFCVEAGRQVSARLGELLRPALGWDTGKFTARLAALCARPGRMRLVPAAHEQRFLAPLALSLLPLPAGALQQLAWLGIRTLGQFAQLPLTSIWQRFGQAGKLAQQWARGHDDRPVSANTLAPPPPVLVEFDPPAAVHTRALAETLRALQPQLAALAARLEGCRRVRLDLRFTGAQSRTLDCVLVEPLGEGPRLHALLAHRLSSLVWPGELLAIHVSLLAAGELVARQLDLFAAAPAPAPSFAALAQKLSGRYGAIFYRAQVHNQRHPVAERRSTFVALSALAAE